MYIKGVTSSLYYVIIGQNEVFTLMGAFSRNTSIQLDKITQKSLGSM